MISSDLFAQQRHAMVNAQIRTNKVTDAALLAALEIVPREIFLPAKLRAIAYLDDNLELAPGRFLLEPMVFARLIQSAMIRRTDEVLVVASGCGFGATVLAAMGARVTALESDPALTALMRQAHSQFDAGEIVLLEAAFIPPPRQNRLFDVIVIEGAVAQLPIEYFALLSAKVGRLVTVLYERDGVGRAILAEKRADQVSHRPLFDAATPLLREFAPELGFVF